MNCFYCGSKTKRGVIRCNDCVGSSKVPMIMAKGSGFTIGSVYTQNKGQSKTFDPSKAPSYRDLKSNGYLDYVKN